MNEMKRVNVFLIVVSLILGSTMLVAQKKCSHHHHKNFFKRLDKDGDGKVAIQDILDFRKDRLQKTDKNGDGFIDKEEFLAKKHSKKSPEHKPRRGKRFFKRFDKDNDGKVLIQDVLTHHKERLQKDDKNGDGFIDRKEFKHLCTKDININF